MSGVDDREVMPGFETIQDGTPDTDTSGDLGSHITVNTLWKALKQKEAQYIALVQLHAQVEIAKQRALRDSKIARYTVMALVTLVFLVYVDPEAIQLQDLLKILF